MEDFRKIFTGLKRAHGCTYVDKKGADGLKIKGINLDRKVLADIVVNDSSAFTALVKSIQ